MREIFNTSGKNFHWLAALEEAAANPHKMKDDETVALRRASSAWPTCACGELCRLLPRNWNERPLDGELTNLGGKFTILIALLQWDYALATFHAIEARAARLLAELLKTFT